MSRNSNTNTTGKVDLNNADAVSGSTVANIQRELNGLSAFTGRVLEGAKDAVPAWADNGIGTANDTTKDRADALTTEVQNKATGPGSATDNAVARYNATTGKLIQDSGVTIDDSNNVVIPGTLTVTSGIIGVSSITKVTKTHTDFQTAGLTNTIQLFSLPTKGMIEKIIIKHSTAFAGTSITAYTFKIGITGTLDKYLAPFDVFQAVGDTVWDGSTALLGIENFGSATSIKITATSVGANLDQSTAGDVEIWIFTSTLT